MAVFRTENRLLWASRLDKTIWSKARVSADYFGAGGPTGKLNRITAISAAGSGRTVSQINIPAVVGLNYTAAAWVRNESLANPEVKLHMFDHFDQDVRVTATLNLSTGVASNLGASAGTGGRVFASPGMGVEILNVGGWHRFFIRGTTTAPASGPMRLTVVLEMDNDSEPGEAFVCGGLRLTRGDANAAVFVDSFEAARVLPTYELFDFPFHTRETEYLAAGSQAQLGRGWSFATKPDAPAQRVFTLRFPAMQHFVGPTGARDLISSPQHNAGLMEDFYQRHQLHEPFLYDHPFWGRLRCRFRNPLKIPQGLPGGTGVLQPFDVTLIEFPIGPNIGGAL